MTAHRDEDVDGVEAQGGDLVLHLLAAADWPHLGYRVFDVRTGQPP
jgi:hypothetical protein